MQKQLKLVVLAAGISACMAAFAGGVSSGLLPVVVGTPHEALFSIAFHESVGIAVGAGGAILQSGDAGKTWKPVTPAPTELSLLAVGVQQGRPAAVGRKGLGLLNDAAGK